MKSNSLITLFAPSPVPQGGSAAYLVSVLGHIAGCAWLILGLNHTPRIETKSTPPRFTVRVLDASTTVPQTQRLTAPGVPHPEVQTASARDLSVDEAPAPVPSAPAQLSKPVHQEQMLVQPDALFDVVLLHKTPVPTAFMWTPDNSPIKAVIQAPPQKSIAAQLRATMDPPNRELRTADIRLAATTVAPVLLSLPASNTSPIVVSTPEPAEALPTTVSNLAPVPAPARIMSLSDFQAEGPVAIPLANATSRPSQSNSMSAGHGVIQSESKNGSEVSNRPGAGPAQATGASPNPAALPNKVGPGSATIAQTGSKSAVPTNPGAVTSVGSGLANLGPVTHVSLPKDGQFGVVVVGSSLAEQYPEIVNVWNGRIIYSVYLHVGRGKNWILQYSLPAGIATGSTRPDAPWPYDMVRPRFDPEDYNSDALLVHGFVNTEGKFERLALVFPSEFAKVKFLLSALQQWEFRPAHQNGQVAAVEVLLIIPEELE